MSEKVLPSNCPSCGAVLKVNRLMCGQCRTSVEGEFDLPLLARLGLEEQEFVLNLVKCNGSLKDMAAKYGVSYPTVRNRLDAVIEKVQNLELSGKSDKEQ